ncbi:MAG: LysR substrate-binding domain-containing protein, partial [Pseudomonadota bacterium]
MDIVQLRTFLSVAETGSFSAAGQALNSVQSNITTRIRKLEDDVGGALFERGRGGAQLTPLGERLMPHARDILHRIDTARADVLDAAGQAAPLRLGALETTAGARLPPVMKALYGRHPSSEITLQTGTSGGLMADVWARRLDAAFVGAPVDPDRFNAIPAYTERLLVARPRDAVAPPALLAFPSGCIYRAAAEAWLQQSGKADMTVRDLGSLESILGLVEAGLGFTVAPETAILGYR